MPVELRKHIGVSTWGAVERPGKTSESVDAINNSPGLPAYPGEGLLAHRIEALAIAITAAIAMIAVLARWH